MTIDEAERDNMNVVHPCAAGLDVHKASAAASVRVWKGGGEDGETATRMFPATHPGFREMAVWLSDRKVTAAAMEATGICREKPLDALEAAGIEAMVLNAQHVKQVRGRKTDVADSVWLVLLLSENSPKAPKQNSPVRGLRIRSGGHAPRNESSPNSHPIFSPKEARIG